MMNKAKKRMYEIEAITLAYGAIESIIDSYKQDIEWSSESRKQHLEEREDADTSYYDRKIEELLIKIEAIKKVLEVIYKLM